MLCVIGAELSDHSALKRCVDSNAPVFTFINGCYGFRWLPSEESKACSKPFVFETHAHRHRNTRTHTQTHLLGAHFERSN